MMIHIDEEPIPSSALSMTQPLDQFDDCCEVGSDTTMETTYHQSLHAQKQQQQVEEEEGDDPSLMYEPSYDMIQRDALTDIFTILKLQENLYGRTDGGDGLKPHLYDSWRPVMVSWMFSVIDAFTLMPEIVTTAIYYLDTVGPSVPNEDFPLLTMAALNVGVKCHETKMFPLDQLVELMGGSTTGSNKREHRYTPEGVIEMERTILRLSQWKLHPPTAHEFLNQYVEVLSDDCEKTIVSTQAISYLKNAYMWEHVLHHQQFPNPPCSYPPSTLAYAALLLALEDSNLPLVEKQNICQILLEVADISAHTPNLTEAYNWLAFSKNLQDQLVINQQLQRMASSSTGTIGPATSPQPQQQSPSSSSSSLAIIEPDEDDEPMLSDSSTSTMGAEPIIDHSVSHDLNDLDDDPQGASITVDDTVNIVTNHEQQEQYYSQDDLADDDDTETSSEVIFFTQTYSGDGFEVVSDGCGESWTDYDGYNLQDDNHNKSNIYGSVEGTANFTDDGLVSWDEEELVLTESTDEDGFEVSYAADGWKDVPSDHPDSKNDDVDRLASLITSPRMVTL
jgi:hypothetical protein